MQTAHLVGIGTSQENLGCWLLAISFQWQDIVFVLQQHHRFLCSLQGLVGMLLRTELLIPLTASSWLLKESKAILCSENTAHCIINTTHRHLTLVDQFL